MLTSKIGESRTPYAHAAIGEIAADQGPEVEFCGDPAAFGDGGGLVEIVLTPVRVVPVRFVARRILGGRRASQRAVIARIQQQLGPVVVVDARLAVVQGDRRVPLDLAALIDGGDIAAVGVDQAVIGRSQRNSQSRIGFLPESFAIVQR